MNKYNLIYIYYKRICYFNLIDTINVIFNKIYTSFFVVENAYEPSLVLNLLITPSSLSLNISIQLNV